VIGIMGSYAVRSRVLVKHLPVVANFRTPEMRNHRCNIVGPPPPGLRLRGGPRRHPSPGGLGWGGLHPPFGRVPGVGPAKRETSGPDPPPTVRPAASQHPRGGRTYVA